MKEPDAFCNIDEIDFEIFFAITKKERMSDGFAGQKTPLAQAVRTAGSRFGPLKLIFGGAAAVAAGWQLYYGDSCLYTEENKPGETSEDWDNYLDYNQRMARQIHRTHLGQKGRAPKIEKYNIPPEDR